MIFLSHNIITKEYVKSSPIILMEKNSQVAVYEARICHPKFLLVAKQFDLMLPWQLLIYTILVQDDSNLKL